MSLVQGITGGTLLLLVVIGAFVGPCRRVRVERCRCGAIMLLTLVLLMLLLTGCKTAPVPVVSPRVSCEPLPLCSVPLNASSTQLDEALWACVLEYRALYSSCANRQTH